LGNTISFFCSEISSTVLFFFTFFSFFFIGFLTVFLLVLEGFFSPSFSILVLGIFLMGDSSGFPAACFFVFFSSFLSLVETLFLG